MMVGDNLLDDQLQQIVDKTIIEADTDNDGKVSFDEFLKMVATSDIMQQLTIESNKI
jgi:serine/threonine-protein phosphatase 2B regulatory subunit